jgi:NAD(P)-dependent dehydrogenase (short-subunit alcohol dehydrogenase family)
MALSRAVLITGCSSGIGAATATLLVKKGWPVYATARKVETLADLEEAGARTLPLDVTDETSMREAVATVESDRGAVGVLINNAGYGLHGAVETTPMSDVRKQFETNFFGVATLTQLVLPKMREQGRGRIVNVSSMGGKLEFPGGAFYHASKHALEAYSDVLRYELRDLGVDVVVIEPGLIKTRFGDAAIDTIGVADDGSTYGSYNAGVHRLIDGAYSGPMGRMAASPERVARAILRAVSAKRPRTRYVITAGARMLLGLYVLLPNRAWDAVIRTRYPRPGGRR